MKTRRIILMTVVLILAVVQWAAASPPREVVIKVNGMFCPFCTFGIEKRLKKLPETADVRTDLAAGEAIVTLKPDAEFAQEHFADAIKRAGFTHAGITLRELASTPQPVTAAPIPPAPAEEISHNPGHAGFSYSKTIGGPGTAPGQFQQPMGIAFAKEGWFVVTDAGNARVQQFHTDGRPWRQWSISGDGTTPLTKPVGLAIGPQGDIWVSDYEADTIHRYGPDGTPRGMFGQSGTEAEALDAPSGLAVTPEGLLAVADFYNHRVQLYSPEGKLIRSIGVQGLLRRVRAGGLNYPTRLAASPDGLLWVADAYHNRVVAFDAEGNVVHRFGKKGHKPGRFDVSAGIALLPDNQLAVADFMNHRIQVWTTDGTLVSDFGTQGDGEGQFERPVDVGWSPDGALYVVDWGNHRIQVFAYKGSPS